MTRNKAVGFTLIELIIVIVIIGILAAIAVPRFINQTSNARTATLNGLAGAINSAVALSQAQYRAEGNFSTSTSTSVTMDGQAVTVIAGSGNPVATAAGIGAALRSYRGFNTPTYAGTTPAGTATYTLPNGPTTNCQVVYTDGTGTAVVTSTGC